MKVVAYPPSAHAVSPITLKQVAEELERPHGHAFISYVREDSDRVDRLAEVLKSAGIRVWRDVDELWPGQDWKIEIKKAINEGSFAFLACLSERSENKGPTYQNEELILAAEQMRLRLPGRTWLIPIRFAECTVPPYDLGAGRSLQDINRVDLFDNTDWSNVYRLITAVTTILRPQPTPAAQQPSPPATAASAGERLKNMLRDPQKEIEVEDLVNDAVARVRDAVRDGTRFPMEFEDRQPDVVTARVLNRAEDYVELSSEILEVMMRGGAYGRQEHEALWARAVQRLGNAALEIRGGINHLLHLRKLPACMAMYAAALGAVQRNNWGSLRAVTTDAKLKDQNFTRFAVVAINPWYIFEDDQSYADMAIQSLVRKEAGDATPVTSVAHRRFTGASDYMEALLKSAFMRVFGADEGEFEDAFDRTEFMMGWISFAETQRAKSDGNYIGSEWYGTFAWRQRRNVAPLDSELVNELESLPQKDTWPPTRAGLFRGSDEFALNAGRDYLKFIAERRVSMH